MMQWSNVTKNVVYFSNCLPCGLHTSSVLQRFDSLGIEALILILEKSAQQQTTADMTDTASQKSVFFHVWGQEIDGAKSGEYGG